MTLYERVLFVYLRLFNTLLLRTHSRVYVAYSMTKMTCLESITLYAELLNVYVRFLC